MPITFTEMQSWANLTKNDPTAWEIEAIELIDAVFLNEARKK